MPARSHERNTLNIFLIYYHEDDEALGCDLLSQRFPAAFLAGFFGRALPLSGLPAGRSLSPALI